MDTETKKNGIVLLSSLALLASCGGASSSSSLPSAGKVVVDDTNGIVHPVSFHEGQLVKDLEKPVKRGCYFEGWIDPSTGEAIDKNAALFDKMELKATWSIDEEDFFAAKKDSEKRYGNANLRVMSFNVLSDDWNDKPKMHGFDSHNNPYPDGVDDGRDYQVTDAIIDYSPDVIGLQECDDEWYETFLSRYEKDSDEFPYRFINPEKTTEASGSHTMYTTILYNEREVELLDSGFRRYSFCENAECRYFVWGLFSRIDDGEEFVLTNTHWELITSAETKKVEQARENVAWMQEVMEEYPDAKVFTTGDYNNLDSNASIKTFLEESEFFDTKEYAENRGLVCDTYHIGNGSSSEPGKWYRGKDSVLPRHVNTSESRDHMFFADGVRCLYLDSVSDERTLSGSDHMPIYADFVF